MFKRLLVITVESCARHALVVLAIAIILASASGYYLFNEFQVNTDINKLISPNLPWRQHEIAYEHAFQDQETMILAVVEGPTAELTEDAAERLTRRLNQEHKHFKSAQQISGGPFFERNGLLFLSETELKNSLSELSRSSSLLAPLAADPSLRGVMSAISLSLRGVQAHRISLDSVAPQFNSLANAIDNAIAHRPAWFSWREFLSGQPPEKRELRQFIEIFPILDYTALEPGREATDAVHRTADDLNLSEHGVKVLLTGPTPLADDDFSTLEHGAALNAALTLCAVLFILWLALHSVRIIIAVFVSLFTGLFITGALGLLLVGAYNPISLAFFVLFVGIGVDFGLQFSVSYRAERFEHNNLFASLVRTASNTGSRLALAAGATAAGFASFTPTSYQGLSELGEVAGVGMIVAFLMSITVLPAMLRLLNPPAEWRPLGYAFLAPVDDFLERHRKAILIGTVCVVIAGLPLLYWLRFDINPMDLRNPNVESVATYLKLQKDPEATGQTIEVLTPSLADADALAKKVSALPEVAKAMTLSSFVPENQDTKIALIHQAASSLNGVLNPQHTEPPPTDAQVISSLDSTASYLSVLAARSQGTPGAEAAMRLSTALSNLAKASPAARARANSAIIEPLKLTLNSIRQSLNPEKITLSDLPPDLVSDWISRNGEARVSVIPRGDPNNPNFLYRFVDAVMKIAPNAAGEAVGVVMAGQTIKWAFIEAGIWALLSIAFLLWLSLRRIRDVALTLFPLLLAAAVTLELTVIIGMPLNFENIIALPVLLGVGVAFKIYYIMAWREGRTGLLSSPLTRAVFFSGMTTAVAFGSLMFSDYPGNASMGRLLALALGCTMAAAVLFQPLLMGPPRHPVKVEEEPEAKPAYLETPEHTA